MSDARATVREYMTPEPTVVGPEDKVAAVRALLDRINIECVPVVNPNGELAGVVSSFDLMRNFVPSVRVRQVMTEIVHTISPDASIVEAARDMRAHGIHHLVVVDVEKVVGMLSSFDLLKAIECSSVMEEALRRR